MWTLERNKNRPRSIPEYIVTNSWNGVQRNIGQFQRIFSPNRMLIVDNNRSEKELVTLTLNTAAKFIRSQLRSTPQNKLKVNSETMDRKRTTSKKKNMSFKDFIKESIIDIPRRRYAPGIFDDADTNNPKLKKVVVDMILDQIDKFQETYPVKKYSLIGSILTKRYRDDADLDINVLFDVPEEDREKARKELASSLKDINGKLVPGTKHPVNYYVITDPELKKKNDAMEQMVYMT